MKELDSFTVERLEEITELKALSFPPSHAESAALARIALASKRAEPVDEIAFDMARGIMALVNETNIGGACQLQAKIQCFIEETLNTTPQLNYPEIPDGWKLVPIEPTQNMVDAHISGMQLAGFSRAYRDMLATAPDASGFDPSFPGAEATVITHYHTPEGYKLVPTEITKAMRDAWDSAPNCHEDDDVNMCNAYRAMIAAAPEPQNQQQNIPEIIPQGWINCSDQMPEDDDFVLIWPLPDFGVELHVGQYIKYHANGPGWFAQVYEQNYGVEFYPITVTHWMPLQTAPEKENG
ncbi:Protein of uncharacterised function (DUF551) [Yersinia frederiksenii]|nr:Protein of uncharacterised function (DUF551) [Yersinia frederiksenii]